MCTAITLKDKDNNCYFGRTMDFSYELNPSIYFSPKHFTWSNTPNSKIVNKYCFIGIGQNISRIVFTEGVNEEGVAVAALYFPGYAVYDSPYSDKRHKIESLEIVNFLLGNCSSVDEAFLIMNHTSIIGVEDNITHAVAPLHWIVTDKTGKCLVIENTIDGLHLMKNPIGVLTNSPNFEWHMTNLNNYLNISNYQVEQAHWNDLILMPFGQGAGAIGLPGDYSPPSRFVRTAFLKSHIHMLENSEEALVAYFHIMNSATIPKGIVMTNRGTIDYTQYISFIDLHNLKYYFKTYNSLNTFSVELTPTLMETDAFTEIGKLSDVSEFKLVS